MKRKGAGCIEIEADLVAAAIGEADTVAEGRVAAARREVRILPERALELSGDRPGARE